jgi:hypothetical protein
VFVLATDAVAASLLAAEDPAWGPLLAADPAPPDRERLYELLGGLSPAPNDDVTVIQIAVPGTSESR